MWTSATAVTVQENATGVVYLPLATDADGNTLTYNAALAGPDAALFNINPVTREVRFNTAPDFEVPTDVGANNGYQLTFTVSDGIAAAVTRDVTITVANVNQGYRLRRVASGLSTPIYLAALPDNTGRVVVLERGGRVRVMNGSTGAFGTDLVNISGIDTSGEKGLLGIAFSRNYLTDRLFYVHMNPTSANVTEIRQYRAPAATDAADPASANAILTVQQPSGSTFTNHKGGFIATDLSNRLLIGLGDGGNGGDPNGNAQNPNVLLGKILRIDPTIDAFPNDPDRDYSIPVGNGFAAGGGSPEILALGYRNPFRGSLDPVTNSIFIGDVGQGVVEEVDRILLNYSGVMLNYGWNRREGTQPYLGGAAAPGDINPVAEYVHGAAADQGDSITGGVVYRGPIEDLQGQYFFADYIRDRLWSIPVSGMLGTTTVPSSAFTLRSGTAQFTPDAGTLAKLTAIGTDGDGNLYFVNIATGDILRLEPLP